MILSNLLQTISSIKIRKHIWLKRLPQCENFIDEILYYELTGGQIENVARKVLLDSILNQKEISLDEIISVIKK